MLIDGRPNDWDLSAFQTPICAGKCGIGDFAVVGYWAGELCRSGYWSGGSMPADDSDHSARVYAMHDTYHIYLLARINDSEINCPADLSSNWQNDCIEIYIDPTYDRGSAPISNSSSDIRLVVDAANRVNVYQCTSAYRSTVLAGTTSAITRDSSGWWAEIRISKAALNPDVEAMGLIGIDFVFRDNDGGNNPSQSTVYSWADETVDDIFPSRIPDQWGEGVLLSELCFAELFNYPNSFLNSNDGWFGTAQTQIVVYNCAVRVGGGAGQCYSDRMVSCAGRNGRIGVWAKVKRGIGDRTLWSLYFDDPTGANLARWYGQGTTARGRIGAGAQVTPQQTLTGNWDDLYVRIDCASNTSDFVFNGTNIGTLNHSEFGAGDTVGRIRIERVDNVDATGHYVFLDNIIIGPADETAPECVISEPSVPITVSGPISYTISFGETVYGFDESDVLVDAEGETSASECTITDLGTGTYKVTLSGISGTGKVGITVKPRCCTDVAGNQNLAGALSAKCAVVGEEGSIAAAKQLPNGTEVTLRNKLLYFKGSGFGYIEEPNRSCGIRIEGKIDCTEGDLVLLVGVMQTTNAGERYISVQAMAKCGDLQLRPVGANNRALRNRQMDGLYVRTWSRVVPGSVTDSSFRITDGSDDLGIKIVTRARANVSDNQLISVSGAAGWDGERVIYLKE